MKFKALPVTGLEDVTLDLEQLSTRAILDKTPTSFLQLLSAQNLQLAFGTGTVTWPGATAYSNTLTIAHGLGRVPRAVVYSGQFMSASPFAATIFENGTPDATNIHPQGFTPGVSPAANVTSPFWWIAIG